MEKLDKYIYLIFIFLLLLVLITELENGFGTASDLAMVVIAGANFIFVVRAFNHDRSKREKEIGNMLMPISFESKMVGDMLAQFAPNHIMTEEQEKQYIKLMSDIKISRHLFPIKMRDILEPAIENSILFINYNTRMRAHYAVGATTGDIIDSGEIVNLKFLYDEEQWIWVNRPNESQKLHKLSEAIDKYFLDIT